MAGNLPQVCYNCEHPFADSDAFCPQCGQQRRPLRPSLGELVGELWESFVKLDGKVIQSLIQLVLRPGRLTAEYMAGRRVRYLRPVTLFLLLAGVFFFVIQWVISGRVEESVERRLDATGVITINIMPGMNIRLSRDQYADLQTAPDDQIRDLMRSVGAKPDSWQEEVGLRALKLVKRGGIQRFRQKMTDVSSRSVVVLIPLMAVWVLLFHRKQITFVEALVYCLHLHSFLFLLLFSQVIYNETIRGMVVTAMIPLCVFYTARSLVVAFGNSAWKAVFKALAILLLHLFVATLLSGVVGIAMLFAI